VSEDEGLREIRQIGDLIDLVDGWEQKFFDYAKGFPLAWYRGQADSDWDLSPMILRRWLVERQKTSDLERGLPPDVWSREITVNRQFRRMAAPLLPGEASFVDVYFLAQRHGLPTRLLDWTTNALAALFFAVSGCPERDGALFVINPRYLIPGENDAGGPPLPTDVVDIRNGLLGRIVHSLYGEGPRDVPSFVLPVLPDITAGRILQQDSCYTLHVPPAVAESGEEAFNEQPADVLAAEHAQKLTVPAADKPRLLISLRRLAVHWATLFHDLDHVVREIRTAWDMYR